MNAPLQTDSNSWESWLANVPRERLQEMQILLKAGSPGADDSSYNIGDYYAVFRSGFSESGRPHAGLYRIGNRYGGDEITRKYAIFRNRKLCGMFLCFQDRCIMRTAARSPVYESWGWNLMDSLALGIDCLHRHLEVST